MKKWLHTSLLMFLSLTLSVAQNRVDYGIFSRAAGVRSLLFRGRLQPHYVQQAPNDGSTYFAYSKDFEKGTVVFRGKLYTDVLMNLNAHTDELCIKDLVRGLAVILPKEYIGSFSIGLHQYEYLKQDVGSAQKTGYYEVLYAGKVKLWKKIRKIFHEEPENGVLRRGFQLSESFYLWKNNTWNVVNKESDLRRLYPDQKNIIKRLARERNLAFGKNRERYLTDVVIYLDQL